MLDAASERAEDIIAATTATVVSTTFFDTIWSALEQAPRPNAALARQARRKRRVVQR
jgi:uncharacterized protein (DUF1778 family)